jgi:Tol biopolymer transport system component
MRALLWRVIFALLVATVAALVSVHVSQAAYPGSNGKIVFWTFDDCCDLIWTVNPDGSDLRAIYSDATEFARYPEVSPDGTKIVVVSGFSITVINFDGKILYVSGYSCFSFACLNTAPGPVWSPDSSRLAWVSPGSFPDTAGLWVGSPTHEALIYPSTTVSPESARWSPDGSKLSLVDRGVLYVINADGTGLHRATSPFPPDPGRTPTSPDGTKRIYVAPVASTAPSTQIFISNLDGSESRQLTNLTAGCPGVTRYPATCAEHPPQAPFNPGFLVWQTLPPNPRG